MKDDRISIQQIYMRLAWMFAGRSTCERLHVGCVITDEQGQVVLGVGYNGNYSGGENTCDTAEPGNCGCLHAEDNACLKLDYSSPFKKVAYITHAPCKMCAKRIVNAKITRVYYGLEYRSTAGINVLKVAGIPVEKIEVPDEFAYQST